MADSYKQEYPIPLRWDAWVSHPPSATIARAGLCFEQDAAPRRAFVSLTLDNIVHRAMAMGLVTERTWRFRTVKNALLPRELLDFLVSTRQCRTRAEAEDVCRALIDAGLLVPVGTETVGAIDDVPMLAVNLRRKRSARDGVLAVRPDAVRAATALAAAAEAMPDVAPRGSGSVERRGEEGLSWASDSVAAATAKHGSAVEADDAGVQAAEAESGGMEPIHEAAESDSEDGRHSTEVEASEHLNAAAEPGVAVAAATPGGSASLEGADASGASFASRFASAVMRLKTPFRGAPPPPQRSIEEEVKRSAAALIAEVCSYKVDPSYEGLRSTVVSLLEEEHVAKRSGWLFKRGHVRKTWRRRWFVLRGTTLSYFREMEGTASASTAAAGQLALADYTLEKANVSRSPLCMRLCAKHELDTEYLMQAESESDYVAWVKTLLLGIKRAEQLQAGVRELRDAAHALELR